MATLGYYPVEDSPPSYDPLSQTISAEPLADWALTDTKLVKGYTITALSLDDAKAANKAAVDAKLASVLTGGYSADFGDATATLPDGTTAAAGTRVLQTRDLADRTNWLTAQVIYQAQVAAGHGSTTGATFRCADNAEVALSYQNGLNVLLAMAAWGAQCLAKSWALKNSVAQAADQDALDAIDIETGWPT